MGLLGDMVVRIKGDTGQFVSSLKSTDRQVRNFTRFIMSGVGIGGAVLIFRQLGKVVSDVVKITGEQEQAEAKLNSAIRATGREASISVRSIASLANALQQTTTYGDEVTLSAAAMLQQLANLDERGLKELLPRVQNFAAAMGIDLVQAASLVGKTLGSSTNALGRYGVQIDMSGSQSEKLAQIIGQLDSKFAGMAESIGKTTSGQLTILRNQFNDLKQELAFELLPTINAITVALVGALKARASFKSAKEILSPEGFQESIANIGNARTAIDLLNTEIQRTEGLLKTQGRYAGTEKERLRQMKNRLEMIQQIIPLLEAQAKAEKKAAAPVVPVVPTQSVFGPTMENLQPGGAGWIGAAYQYQQEQQKKLVEQEKTTAEARVQAIIDEVTRKKEAWDEEARERQAIENELWQAGEDRRRKEENDERIHQWEMTQLRQAAFDTAATLIGSLAAIASNYYAGQLDNEELTDKERKKIQRKQASTAKAMAIFEAIINTASAIAEALPNIPLSIFAGIAGAVQIAAIASQPLPKLARGGKLTRPTMVVAGEAGPEWYLPESRMNELGGKILSAMQQANITNVIQNDQPIQLGIYLDGKQLNAHIQKSIGDRRIVVRKESVA
jgi:hypothetical protein